MSTNAIDFKNDVYKIVVINKLIKLSLLDHL